MACDGWWCNLTKAQSTEASVCTAPSQHKAGRGIVSVLYYAGGTGDEVHMPLRVRRDASGS